MATLADLLKRLKEKNPKANEKELKELFINGIREDPDLVSEAVDWFIDQHYPTAKKN